jgi:biofilm PGA synthesis N-glycosyltransferase PgaC
MALLVCALLAVALLGFTYVGYPIVIGVLARLFPVPIRRSDAPPAGPGGPLVSVCLPVFNGAKFLPAKIDSLLSQDYPPHLLEILIYCDGCTDDSEEVARRLAASSVAAGRIRVLASAVRRGKPAAINAVGVEAQGDLLLLTDVRQPFSRNTVAALAHALTDPGVGCATGNLVLAGGAASGVYWRYENWIRRQESRFRGVVGMTGAIAMLRRADLMPLPEALILDDVFMPMQLVLRGKRVEFVTAAEAYDAAFEDDHEFRRKVRTLAGNFQLFALMPALLLPNKNPIWLETASHKILRLMAPWIMIGLAGISIAGALAAGTGIAPWLMPALVLAQLVFYAAAAAGRRAGRLGGVARTFVVLNSAAVVGLVKFIAGRQRVTW